MRTKVFHFHSVLLLTAMACAALCLAPGTAAADDPVTVTVEVTGTPAMGAVLTAKATVTINDGSAMQSIMWSQEGGAAATLANEMTDTVTVTLGDRAAYRAYLIHVLGEPPIELESEHEHEEEEFVGGIQNRFGTVGVNPLSLEHAAIVTLDITVVTTSGTYHHEAEIEVSVPWAVHTGIRNVPVGVPVILHAKDQAAYNWALTKPNGSSAALMGATTQSPEFTPDMPGMYVATVTDMATSMPVPITVFAGLWKGVITGQDADGRPTVDTTCTQCHNALPRIEKFSQWIQTGHAEIFTNNVNNPNGHYSTSCVGCHTVGYNTGVANNGIDDQTDWQALLDSGKLTHGAVDNWTEILAQFPKAARLANIQCENCHGPQDSTAHYQGQGARMTLSSDMCGVCHGEPLRHARYQQWQISPHANYELAGEEGMSGSCSKCHTANGFLAWLPVLKGDKPGDPNADVQVTWTQDEIHPQTCQTCHDPHAIGTTTGSPNTNATVRISGDTPMLLAGFKATDVGRGAICMTCHNTRRGLKNDSTFSLADASRAPHVGAQADIIMGQNMYLVEVGTRSYHSHIEDVCVTCHMEKTPPPDELSYNRGGTNHTFIARHDICSQCHSTITTESVQGPVEEKVEELKAAIEEAIYNLMAEQIAAGKKIAIGSLATISNIDEIESIEFTESHGRQAIAVTLTGGTQLEATGMNNVKAVPPVGAAVDLYRLGDPALAKAGWNLIMVETDGSKGVHNPTFVKEALNTSIYAVTHIPAAMGAGADAGKNGGPGTGVGAVSCTSPYVYWAEIAAHLPGDNQSQWRTDVVGRNLASATATLKFFLHTATATYEGAGTIAGGAQGNFEDIVAKLGQTNAKGALEICSDKPLLVAGRMFTTSSGGTYGQFVDGHVANLGMAEGDIATLLGLRQALGQWRTNISVTNGGTDPATVEVTLYNAAGAELVAYELTIPPGQVVQDLKPFEARAAMADLGWGFATVKVLDGFNVRTSASVIDEKTNDPYTVAAKQ